MHRTTKLLLDDRLIDLTKHLSRTRGIRSNHNPVGVQKVLHRGAFAQKFRIGRDLVPQSVGLVYRQVPSQLSASLYRYRALFNYQSVPRGSLGNSPGDRFDAGAHLRLGTRDLEPKLQSVGVACEGIQVVTNVARFRRAWPSRSSSELISS